MSIKLQSKPDIGAILLRGLVVGVVYALASALVAAILGPMSRLTPTFDNILVWLLAGTLICLALSPFILYSNWSRTKTVLAVWAVQAFVRSLGLGIEGSLFKPTAALNAILGAIFGILVSLLVAWLAVLLLMPADQTPQEDAGVKRNWWAGSGVCCWWESPTSSSILSSGRQMPCFIQSRSMRITLSMD